MWNVCRHFTTSAKAHGSGMFTWAPQTSITGSFGAASRADSK